MRLHAAAARRERGAVVGGDEGRALIEAADGTLATQGVADVAAFFGTLHPSR